MTDIRESHSKLRIMNDKMRRDKERADKEIHDLRVHLNDGLDSVAAEVIIFTTLLFSLCQKIANVSSGLSFDDLLVFSLKFKTFLENLNETGSLSQPQTAVPKGAKANYGISVSLKVH